MSDKHTQRNAEVKKAMMHRLNRIEGQVRGVKNMLDTDAYCIDIINQTAAIRSALSAFSNLLLEKHIQTCVRQGIGKGDAEVVDELLLTIKKMIK
ncbi:MAG: metal-sensing transcriptional repressor [Clostridiales bacterium]|nr:metal-sensing transcriptional repressor [Clostridiales bacterium]